MNYIRVEINGMEFQHCTSDIVDVSYTKAVPAKGRNKAKDTTTVPKFGKDCRNKLLWQDIQSCGQY